MPLGSLVCGMAQFAHTQQQADASRGSSGAQPWRAMTAMGPDGNLQEAANQHCSASELASFLPEDIWAAVDSSAAVEAGVGGISMSAALGSTGRPHSCDTQPPAALAADPQTEHAMLFKHLKRLLEILENRLEQQGQVASMSSMQQYGSSQLAARGTPSGIFADEHQRSAFSGWIAATCHLAESMAASTLE